MKAFFRILGLACLLSIFLLCTVCSDKTDNKSDGDVDREADYSLTPKVQWQKDREEAYLRHSCDGGTVPSAIGGLLLRLECAKRWEGYKVPDGALADDTYDSIFEKMFRLKDTSDFNANEFINLLYAHRGHPVMSEAVWVKIEEAMLNFKYWFTDPTPERKFEEKPVIDNMWYWTENHVLLFRSCEYLMGQMFPDRTFSVTGWKGAQHRDRAKPELLKWFEERMRWGFSEWHSDVYYSLDISPLLTLIEWAEDEEIAFRAAQVLDLFMLDIALHLHSGNMGVTHGRSYIKDKPTAFKQNTYDISKLLFDDTTQDYQSKGSKTCAYLARGNKYALPEVIRNIAGYDEPMVDRERMNPPLDETPPENWDDPITPHPLGLAYDDEAELAIWWSLSAFTTWPLIPMTLEIADRYNLWESQFKDFAMMRDLVDFGDPEADPMELLYPFYQILYPILGMGLLVEVNTYTYRDRYVMLSSALDYRPGLCTSQAHHWQATLSESAVVFTTHPAYLPIKEGDPIPENWNWQRQDEPGPGYWTGSATRPRSAQYKTVGIHIYAPQYAPKPLGQNDFDYREETHAYFPHSHFDEVLQESKWTFGRKDDGYVALYSHLPTTWRDGQPEVFDNDGLPFDLVAVGSAQNVWIVEVGSIEGFDSFAKFKAAILAASVKITPISDQDDNGHDDGFNVSYDSPAQGLMKFGWYGPLNVAEKEIPQSDFPRYDNPFVQAEFDTGHYEITFGDTSLFLDHRMAIREF